LANNPITDWSRVRVQPAPDARTQEFDGEVVLVDLKRGEYFGLDGVGALVWTKLQARATLDEMVTAVTAAYDVDADTCRADLVSLLDQLRHANLIKSVPV